MVCMLAGLLVHGFTPLMLKRFIPGQGKLRPVPACPDEPRTYDDVLLAAFGRLRATHFKRLLVYEFTP
jgi:hypothetical protein